MTSPTPTSENRFRWFGRVDKAGLGLALTVAALFLLLWAALI